MTDITFDFYLLQMTNAQRTAWTPVPGPAPGPPGQFLLPLVVESDTGDAFYWDEQNGGMWVAWPGGALSSIADDRIIANISGGAAVPVANTLTAIIDACIGNTQGNILYRNNTAWVALAPGTAGHVLTTGGAAANPSWAAASGGGSVTHISTQTASSSSTLSFTSIPGTYKHLQLMFYGRGAASANNVDLKMTFNGDTGNNYNGEFMVGFGTNQSDISQRLAAAFLKLGDIVAANGTANFANGCDLTIRGYAQTTFHKSLTGTNLFSLNTSSGNTNVAAFSGLWMSTAAITQIDLTLSSGNFVDGSEASLYGISG